MSKGDLNLEKNKKPVEMQRPREAEDIKLNRNVDFLMERPGELNVISEHDFSKVMNSPLINREMKRRKAEAGEDAEWNYQKEMVEKAPQEVIDRAEKNWVAGEMDKLTQRAEKRKEQERKEQERKEQEEQELKEQEEQARLEQERKVRERTQKKREYLFVNDNLNLAPKRLQVHMPEKTVLKLNYSERFSNSIGDKKRKEKQRNKKSRLYQKLKNDELLTKNIKDEQDLMYKRVREQIGADDDISTEDFNDLAQFMIYRDKYKNQELSDLMLGAKNAEGNRSVDAYHARLALTKMADQLLEVDVFSLKFDTDHDIAVNATQLESLTNRLAAFDRLSAKYKYMESLTQGKRLELNSKLRALSSVAAYYVMRRDIITNDIYKNHYDHELTMDVTKAAAKDASPKERKAERELAEKLVKSYVLGRNMLRINGVPVKTINKMRDPGFKNAEAVNFLNKIKSDYEEQSDKSDQNMMKLVKAGYASTDAKAGSVLDDLREEPAMRIVADELLEQSAEKDEEAELLEQKKEDLFAGNVLKTLLTSDELIPLRGTREMGAVRNSIQALQAMLSSNMPGFEKTTGSDRKEKDETKTAAKARDEIDGTCIAVVMLYKRLSDNIDDLVKRYKEAYEDLAAMLKELADQSKKESESFREKTLEYYSLMSADKEQKKLPHTWMDALKYNRGEFYDLDNDKNISVEIDGAGASKVYKITKKVEVTETNPKGEEIVYFRTKDCVPPANDAELISAVISRHEVSKETAKKIKDALIAASKVKVVNNELFDTLKELKKVKADPKIVANNVIRLINQNLTVGLNIPKEEYEIAGQIFLDWKDDRAKRAMAHDMRKSAHIDCGRNLSDRNVATSRLAQLFGIQSMVCDSRTAYVKMNGKVIEGNLMENTGGDDTLHIKAGYSPNAISQIFMMQIFDYICGQTDRHFGNFHGIVQHGNIDVIKCLDNDMAFGKLKSTHIGDEGLNRILPITDEGLMGLPVSFVNRLMAIDRAYLDQVVGDILNKEELDAFEERLDAVRSSIIEMANRREDTKWDAKTKKLSYIGEKGDDQLRQIWTLQLISKAAVQMDTDMRSISRFSSENYRLTNTSALMRKRKQELAAQKQKRKNSKKK